MSLTDIFHQYGLTGNTIIDSLILTSIIPLIISYVTNLTNIITKIIMSLWELLIEYLLEKLRIKLFGNKMSTIIISYNNTLYDFIKDEIYSKNTLAESTSASKSKTIFLHHIYNIIKSFKKYQHNKNYWKNSKEKNPPIVPELYRTEEGNYFLDYNLEININNKDSEENARNGKSINNTRLHEQNFNISLKKYFEQDGYTLAIKNYSDKNFIKIAILNYHKNTNSNEENNKIAMELFNKFAIERLEYNKTSYHRLSFEIGNIKLRECLSELITTPCPVSTIQCIIDSFYVEKSNNDNPNGVFTDYEITLKRTENNNASSFNNIVKTLEYAKQECNTITDETSDKIKEDFKVPPSSIPVTTTDDNYYVLNGGTINFSTNIINAHINDYKNYIKVEHNSQNVKTFNKSELLKILGKNKIENYNTSQINPEQYFQGYYPKSIICDGYQMFNFNGIYVYIYNDLTRPGQNKIGKSYVTKMIISKFGSPVTKNELNNIINNAILLSFKIKPFEDGAKETKTITVYKYETKLWKQVTLERRTLDTIYLPSKLLKDILNEINTFMDKKKLYDKFEIYYKKGLLFYGPPGTGKTSLVRALSCHFKIPIYIINVNDVGINDDSIVEILNMLPGGSEYKIVLYEDIDSAFSDKEVLVVESKYNPSIYDEFSNEDDNQNNEKKEEEKSKNNLMKSNTSKRKYLTYSGLLNALDGILSNQKGNQNM